MCRFFWFLLVSAIMTATPSIGAASSIPYPGSSPYILPERLAFVIGIDNCRYGNIGLLRLKQLEQASEDARRMEEALRAFGFKVEKKFVLRTGPNKLHINKDEIHQALNAFVSQIIANRKSGKLARPPIVTFYFAGHGFNLRCKEYFAPSNFFAGYSEDNEETAISLE